VKRILAALLLGMMLFVSSPAFALPSTSPLGTKPSIYGSVQYQIVGNGTYVEDFHGTVSNFTASPITAEVWVFGPNRWISSKQFLIVPGCSLWWPWAIPMNRRMATGDYYVNYILTGILGGQTISWSYWVS
jgi:hypothetical protein